MAPERQGAGAAAMFYSRQNIPLAVYFVLSGTPLMMWAWATFGLLVAIELAIPGVVIAKGLQLLMDRGMLAARADVLNAIVAPLELGIATQRLLEAATGEARRRGHNYVGTEHILIALATETSGVGVGMLEEMEVESQALLAALEFVIGRDVSASAGEPVLTPRAMAVIELAGLKARASGHWDVGVGDVMEAIVGEGAGVSAGILRGLMGSAGRDLRQGA